MIGLLVLYFGKTGRNTNYLDYHTKKFVGETPEECMAKFKAFSDSHDYIRNTKPEIIDVSTIEE